MMVGFISKILINIKDNNKLLVSIRYYSVLRFLVKFVANLILPLLFHLTRNNIKYRIISHSNVNEPRIIVSFTSFPLRIKRVWLVVESILRQSIKPDKIILWLSKEQFQSMDYIPKRLVVQQSRGLEIRLVEGDLKSHKKYYYSAKEYSQDIIITIDDDILYKPNMLSELISSYNNNPNNVICNWGRIMKFGTNGIEPYKSWKSIKLFPTTSRFIFFGSGGGTLFPPLSLNHKLINLYVIKNIVLNADDVILNAVINLKTINKTILSSDPLLGIMIWANNVNLSEHNYINNHNDKQIKELSHYCIENYKTNPFSPSIKESV